MILAQRNPGRRPLVAYQGSTYDRTFRLRYQSSGEPYDLTNHKARMEVRDTAGNRVLLLISDDYEDETADGAIILGGTEGTVRLLIPASSMVGKPVGAHNYDIEIVATEDDIDVVAKMLADTFSIRPEVTTYEGPEP